MIDLRTIAGTALAAALAYLFVRYVLKRNAKQAELPAQLFAEILPLLENVQLANGEAVGSWQVIGNYRNRTFQIKAITDTLAVRKLPSLWLMMTLPEPQPVPATFDVMMRPQGPTTFSNFDFLSHTLPTPDGFPQEAVVRSDSAAAALPREALLGPLKFLEANRGKELLISPKGLRFVLQAAEADRARYGVYREANFGDTAISGNLVQKTMDILIDLSERLNRV
jgi:hypothetical protein